MPVDLSRDGEFAIIRIDNPPVNATSHAVRAGLLKAVETISADPAIAGVVIVGAGRTFVAGGDIREFDKPPLPPTLSDVLLAVEALDRPVVAAIGGAALGGGLELAMACHYRVASASAKLGLPEVGLGLIPGAGGTIRLPRLVAPDVALDMVAGGKPVGAIRAREIGLVDEVVTGDPLEAAKTLLHRGVSPRPTRANEVRPTHPKAFDAAAKRWRARARGQVSIKEAVEAMRRALDLPFDEALQAEGGTFRALKASPQSSALRHLFFAERATLDTPRCTATLREIGQIGVVGGGTMGAGIAAACLLAGFEVRMADRDADATETGRARVEEIIEGSTRRGVIPDADAALKRFEAGPDLNIFASADLVIEAVFEDLEVKTALFRDLDRAVRADAILATNTSYLDVNRIAAAVDDPSRVIGLHFFSPAHIMKLLEIVTPDAVADDVVASAARLARKLGKIGVFAGVCDGFIGNRIMSAYRFAADLLLVEGATPAEIDDAMTGFGFPMGIYAMQDMAGLDISWAMRKRRAAETGKDAHYIAIADRLCQAGRFGRKSGAGWFDYVDGKPQSSDAVAREIAAERAAKGSEARHFSPAEIVERLLVALWAEADAVLAEGVARNEADIDVVMVNGYGFPRWRGGPMWWRRSREDGERPRPQTVSLGL